MVRPRNGKIRKTQDQRQNKDLKQNFDLKDFFTVIYRIYLKYTYDTRFIFLCRRSHNNRNNLQNSQEEVEEAT